MGILLLDILIGLTQWSIKIMLMLVKPFYLIPINLTVYATKLVYWIEQSLLQ